MAFLEAAHALLVQAGQDTDPKYKPIRELTRDEWRTIIAAEEAETSFGPTIKVTLEKATEEGRREYIYLNKTWADIIRPSVNEINTPTPGFKLAYKGYVSGAGHMFQFQVRPLIYTRRGSEPEVSEAPAVPHTQY